MGQQAATAAHAAATRRKIAGERPSRAPRAGSLGAGDGARPASLRHRTHEAEGFAGTSSARPGQPILLRIGRAVPGWLLVGLAVVTVAVLALDGIAWARSISAGSAAPIGPDSLSAAPAAAEKAAEQILGYDYAQLQHDTDAAAALMTPAYAQTFERTVRDLLADPATAERGVVTATVTASGVVSATAGRVDVLLFVDQTSTTKASKTPQTALNRVVLSMVDQGGQWLVDDVTAL